MRFLSIVAAAAALSTSSSIVASPVAVAVDVDVILSPRQTGPAGALTLLQNLLTSVKTYTAAINATAATITAVSSELERSLAIRSIGASITGINAEVVAATAVAGGLTPVPKPSGEIVARQVPSNSIAAALQALLFELVGTLNGLIASLGLAGLLSFLNPLLSSLGLLVLALIPVVDNLLAVVEQLLDGILYGLGTALMGLIL